MISTAWRIIAPASRECLKPVSHKIVSVESIEPIAWKVLKDLTTLPSDQLLTSVSSIVKIATSTLGYGTRPHRAYLHHTFRGTLLAFISYRFSLTPCIYYEHACAVATTWLIMITNHSIIDVISTQSVCTNNQVRWRDEVMPHGSSRRPMSIGQTKRKRKL